MIEEDPNKGAADPNSGKDRGLSVFDQQEDIKEVFEKIQRSRHDNAILREALGFMKASESRQQDAKWIDARYQSGPSPADFGDHKPIPIDAMCMSPVLATDDAVVDDVPETVQELEADLRSERRKSNG